MVGRTPDFRRCGIALPCTVMASALRILLVENHEDTLLYLRRHLENNGHSVTAARSAGEAMEAAREQQADVLLCDIGLPDVEGWSLLTALADTRPPLCIAMSGYGMSSDLQRSREAGFHHHLVKPFLPSHLDELLPSP